MKKLFDVSGIYKYKLHEITDCYKFTNNGCQKIYLE